MGHLSGIKVGYLEKDQIRLMAFVINKIQNKDASTASEIRNLFFTIAFDLSSTCVKKVKFCSITVRDVKKVVLKMLKDMFSQFF